MKSVTKAFRLPDWGLLMAAVHAVPVAGRGRFAVLPILYSLSFTLDNDLGKRRGGVYGN